MAQKTLELDLKEVNMLSGDPARGSGSRPTAPAVATPPGTLPIDQHVRIKKINFTLPRQEARMATSSSPGGAGQGAKEDEPATPEQQCSDEKGEIIASTASGLQHVASSEEEQEEEVIRLLEVLLARASELLQAAGQRRVTGDIERRCLAFMKMKLRDIAALLKSSDSPLQDHDAQSRMRQWVEDLDLLKYANNLLEIAKPRRCSLGKRGKPLIIIDGENYHSYQRAALYCCSRIAVICSLLEHPGRYRHLLPTGSNVGLPPQLAEVGSVPLVGIDRPINKLFRWLALRREETDRGLSAMSIVGPVGIGKTALAMDLHNRLKCQATGGRYYFHCNIMARMSWRTERNEILLQDILSKISDPATPALPSVHHSRPPTMDLLVTHVSERLQNKRYFICIDGMLEASDWDNIKGAFPDNNLGSRILITTRDGSIAWASCSYSYTNMLVHQMKPLNWLDSERLLLVRAFGSQLDVGRRMRQSFDGLLHACGGVPLFIIVTVDRLKQRFQEEMWLSEDWEGDWYEVLRQEPFLHTYLRRELSYTFDDLYQFFFEVRIPYRLMILLLYMSTFSHGHKFEKDHLITKWIYEGLARDPGEAELYFSQLIDRNIITSTAASSPDENEAWQLHMNCFIQEFLVNRSAEIGLAFIDATLAIADASTPRRLVLHHSNTLIPLLPRILDLSQTRSLAVSGAVDGVPLDKFVNLVVLDLEGWVNLTVDDLRQVCTSKMSLLQYLSVRNTQISKLPHEIENLCSLMVLDISYTQISELPLEVFELELLKGMLLKGTQIRQLPKQIVGLKYTLRSIILGGEGRVNLNGPGIMVPHDIQHLRRLVTLVTIDLSEQPANFVKALGSLRDLQFLAITWSFHQSTHRSYREALLSSIKKWLNLKSLTIHCGLGCSMEFLGSLSDPPEKLEKFKVTVGRFASVPKWINKLQLLSLLQITICKQGTDDLKILGDLLNLRCLILGLDFIPEETIAIIENDGFKELQRFSLNCPMPWLSFSTGAMRKLTYLQLKFCAIPTRQSKVPSGLENLGSLTEVVLCYDEHYAIANSPSIKMTVEAVRLQVAKHRNPIDLFINGTEDDVQIVEEDTEFSHKTHNSEWN